ncbi:hypothetical protein Nepgr_003177 [Nepenthes gracilis]|uniref:Homeobox-leucine zipper protein n=1 Tax=Nepenthes gracilis TaxID=150966 RepID=A0AAD3RZ19_NEPGR|nr:hypothetical protein Nepgr_003177 [Nepenthes gracilis]
MAVAGGKLCGGGASNISALLQTQTLTRSSQPPDARFILGSSPSFMGSCSMVSFEDGCGGKRPERSFARKFDQEDDDDDVGIDYYFHQPKKKRRLTHEQVQVLEGSFEANNNLESERRIKLANDLGLQPRQVAIWFQNRRVRWKTKKLEKDFDSMQSSFNHLKADFENLLKEVEELKAEVLHLKDRLLFKGKSRVRTIGWKHTRKSKLLIVLLKMKYPYSSFMPKSRKILARLIVMCLNWTVHYT